MRMHQNEVEKVIENDNDQEMFVILVYVARNRSMLGFFHLVCIKSATKRRKRKTHGGQMDCFSKRSRRNLTEFPYVIDIMMNIGDNFSGSMSKRKHMDSKVWTIGKLEYHTRLVSKAHIER